MTLILLIEIRITIILVVTYNNAAETNKITRETVMAPNMSSKMATKLSDLM